GQPISRMRRDAHSQVQIPGRAIAAGTPALPGQPDPLPVHHPGRDGHGVDPGALEASEGDLTAAAPVRLLDAQLQLGLLIGAGNRTGRPTRAATRPEEVSEQVLEAATAEARLEARRHPEPLARAPASGAGTPEAGAGTDAGGHPFLVVLGYAPEVGAEPVVPTPGLRVRQHLVGVVDLLETLLRRRILVHVRVVAAGELPVGLLDLLRGRRAADAESLVVVPGHGVTPRAC